jgi:hypothetical protein
MKINELILWAEMPQKYVNHPHLLPDPFPQPDKPALQDTPPSEKKHLGIWMNCNSILPWYYHNPFHTEKKQIHAEHRTKAITEKEKNNSG